MATSTKQDKWYGSFSLEEAYVTLGSIAPNSPSLPSFTSNLYATEEEDKKEERATTHCRYNRLYIKKKEELECGWTRIGTLSMSLLI
eukprot:818225-Ditylum_brightwellii.AAC.2